MTRLLQFFQHIEKHKPDYKFMIDNYTNHF